jgi:hypothetical protein
LLTGLVKQGNKVLLWRHSKNRDEDAKQYGFISEEAGHTRISLGTRVLNVDKLGSKGSQAEARNLQREKRKRKAPEPKAGESEEEAGARNMELTGLFLRNTDVVGGKPRF